MPLPHLDRPFDYLVAAQDADRIQLGSRVRVRFAGRLVDGYVVGRGPVSDHPGRLAFIERTVGDEPVLSAETVELCRQVADRWCGNFVDVVRLAVPARHAGAEKGAEKQVELTGPSPLDTTKPAPAGHGFGSYRAGQAFFSAVTDGRPARAVWSALPGEDWPTRLAEAARLVAGAGRGVVVAVPDARDLTRLDAALAGLLGTGHHVALSAELGPAERYRRWLAVRRGQVRIVIGTRAAAYAPVSDPGLFVVWDDGDDLHDEPRAPYPNTRDTFVLRSAQTGAGLLVAGFARTTQAQALVEAGWAHEIGPDRDLLRQRAPRVRPVGDDIELARDAAATAARLPSLAWRVAREALANGSPVLVQVPRRGYVPALACVRDRTPARCPACSGPLAAAGERSIPTCRWCARPAANWCCPTCGQSRLRAVVVGSARTAEELGRALPGVTIRTSGGDRVLDTVADRPAIVVATPGAEPYCPTGYGAALLLDGWALLSRADLRATEETFRRWVNAAALVRACGTVVVGADASVPAVQALVRWDPAGAAARELDERRELSFPPVSRLVALTGTSQALRELLAAAELPEWAQQLGTAPLTGPGAGDLTGPGAGDADSEQPPERVLLRAPRERGRDLARVLKTAASARSARRGEPVRIRFDPPELI